eukprot:6173377-Pleurochrysis_carterae.AAC.2
MMGTMSRTLHLPLIHSLTYIHALRSQACLPTCSPSPAPHIASATVASHCILTAWPHIASSQPGLTLHPPSLGCSTVATDYKQTPTLIGSSRPELWPGQRLLARACRQNLANHTIIRAREPPRPPLLEAPLPPRTSPAASSASVSPRPCAASETGPACDPDADADAGANPDADADPGFSPDADTDAGINPDADADPGANPDPDADPGFNADADADAGANPDADADP